MLRWWYESGPSYNEVIVDVAFMNEHLPLSVEAFLCDRATHAQFLRFYSVNETQYPLVGFDNAWREAGKEGPFFLLDHPLDEHGRGPRQPTCT